MIYTENCFDFCNKVAHFVDFDELNIIETMTEFLKTIFTEMILSNKKNYPKSSKT